MGGARTVRRALEKRGIRTGKKVQTFTEGGLAVTRNDLQELLPDHPKRAGMRIVWQENWFERRQKPPKNRERRGITTPKNSGGHSR